MCKQTHLLNTINNALNPRSLSEMQEKLPQSVGLQLPQLFALLEAANMLNYSPIPNIYDLSSGGYWSHKSPSEPIY